MQLTAPNVLAATLTGTVAANAILGCSSSATQTFHLEQEFEIASPQTSVSTVAITLESTLLGLVRSKGKASASARLAAAKLCPLGVADSSLVLIHPPSGAGGTCGKLCNQRLDPLKIPALPVGRYLLVADFVLAAEASGATDAHSAADFSPSTALPADWVRARDPFQGVDKKDFGFKVILTVEPPSASLASRGESARDPKVAHTTLISRAAQASISAPASGELPPTGGLPRRTGK